MSSKSKERWLVKRGFQSKFRIPSIVGSRPHGVISPRAMRAQMYPVVVECLKRVPRCDLEEWLHARVPTDTTVNKQWIFSDMPHNIKPFYTQALVSGMVPTYSFLVGVHSRSATLSFKGASVLEVSSTLSHLTLQYINLITSAPNSPIYIYKLFLLVLIITQ